MNRNTAIKAEGYISIIINCLLFGIKYWAGIVSGSLALIADAWHTLSDSLSSMIVLIANKMAQKPADSRHPFGHGRIEIISANIIGILLAVIGYEFFKDAIIKFTHREKAFFGTTAIVVTIISIVLKEGLAQFALIAGKKFDAKILLADAWHHRSDAVSSIAVLIGILIGRKIWWIDSLMGLVISFMLFFVALKIIRKSIDTLMGRAPGPEMTELIEGIVHESYPDLCIHHLHIHNYGEHKEITFHIGIQEDMKLKDAHHIADSIEQKLREKYKIESTIHVDALS